MIGYYLLELSIHNSFNSKTSIQNIIFFGYKANKQTRQKR